MDVCYVALYNKAEVMTSLRPAVVAATVFSSISYHGVKLV